MIKFFKNKFEDLLFFYSYLKNKIFISLLISIFVGFTDGIGIALFLPLIKMSNSSNQDIDESQLEDLSAFVVTSTSPLLE